MSLNVPTEIKRGENLLLQGSPFIGAVEEHCVELMTAPPSDDCAVLEVTYQHTPAHRIETWEKYRETGPSNWTIITVNPEGHHVDPTETESISAMPTTVSVPASADVSTLGTRITDWLDRFDEQAEEIAFCFYSISSLFQYTGRSLGLKFLDALTSKTAEVDARAHFHMDPRSHDKTTREDIEGRFDTVLSIE